MNKNKLYHYRAFGLNIESEIEFPQMHAIDHNDISDVSIVFSKLEGYPKPEKWIEKIDENKVLVYVPGVVYCLVENSNTINVEPVVNVPLQDIRIYLQAIVMVVLLYQKSIAPLHACGIVYKNKCHVFAGDSGIGKSTLAGAFFKRGFQVVCDDLCILRKNSDDSYAVHPGYPFIKLWKESLEKLAIPYDGLDRVHSADEKYYVPLTHNWNSAPVPLGSINFLNCVEKNEISIQPLKTLDKFAMLKNNLFRPYLVNLLELHQPVFNLSKTIVQQVPLSIIERPQHAFMLDELVDTLINQVLDN